MNLEYLKEFRLANSRTQTEFAKSIGCPQSTYHYVEVGKTQLDALQLKTLCEKYKNFDLFIFLEIENKYQNLIDNYDGLYQKASEELAFAKDHNENLQKTINDLVVRLDNLKDTTLELLLEERKSKKEL